MCMNTCVHWPQLPGPEDIRRGSGRNSAESGCLFSGFWALQKQINSFGCQPACRVGLDGCVKSLRLSLETHQLSSCTSMCSDGGPGQFLLRLSLFLWGLALSAEKWR